MKQVIKICGMRDPANVVDIAALKPDLLGFIFHVASPRFVGDSLVIPSTLKAEQRVGVFVDADFETIEKIRKQHELGWIQLHGHESVGTVQAGHARGWKIIKAFSVNNQFDFSTTEAFAPYCDYFLFDTKGPQPGGNGRVFDWGLLNQYNGHTPFLLSGGLRADMATAIKSFQHPLLAGYDFNSGLEMSPAIKSVELVANVMNALKREML
jgi:phosphoribosylanthranilate isomerase